MWTERKYRGKFRINIFKSIKSGFGSRFLTFLAMCGRIWVKFHNLSITQWGTWLNLRILDLNPDFVICLGNLITLLKYDFLTCKIEKIIVPIHINLLCRFMS